MRLNLNLSLYCIISMFDVLFPRPSWGFDVRIVGGGLLLNWFYCARFGRGKGHVMFKRGKVYKEVKVDSISCEGKQEHVFTKVFNIDKPFDGKVLPLWGFYKFCPESEGNAPYLKWSEFEFYGAVKVDSVPIYQIEIAWNAMLSQYKRKPLPKSGCTEKCFWESPENCKHCKQG